MTDSNNAAMPSTGAIPVAPDNPFYEIRAVPGKGYGCIAKAPIPRGTRILSDPPLISVPVASYLASDILHAYTALSPSQQALYQTLHSAHAQPTSAWPAHIHPSTSDHERQRILEQHAARTNLQPSLLSIFQTNCMEQGAGAAVFPNAARFNHSCVPNACFAWNEAIGRETVHVMRDVGVGEEVVISYVDAEHGKRLRAWELRHYGFVCGCAACGDEDDVQSYAHKSEQRRFQLMELNREMRLLRGARLGDGARHMGFAEKMLQMAVLLQNEGIWDARLAGIFFDLALVCEVNGDYRMGVMAGEKALLIKRDCQGTDFPDYGRYAEAVKRIKAGRRRHVDDA